MGGEKPLLISALNLPGNLSTDEAFVVACSLGRINKIKTTFLLNTGATGIAFIDLEMARHVCDVLKISFIQLAKPKPIREFNGKPVSLITYAIYLTLTVQGNTKSLAFFLITKLGQHLLILGKSWIWKHGVVLDMSCDKLAFWPRHCQHPGSFPKMVNTSIELYLSTSMYLSTSAIMLLATHVKNPITSAIAPAESQKLKKSKKSKPIEIPPAIPGVQLAYQSVSKLADSKGEKYVVLAKRILKSAMVPKLKAELVDETKLLDLTFINTALIQYLAKQKDMEIFAVSMWDIKNEFNAISRKDIKYQLNKTAKTSINLKTVVPEKYHKFLNVFLKEASDTLLSHSKYNHQICLLEGYKDHGHSPLSKIPEPKLQFVKKFLEEHLKKGFIEASSTPCSSHIMLAAKLGGGIRFCVNYRHLNKLIKKDAYPIPLIKEILAQLKNVKVFTKIDIRQAFHKLKMAIDSKDLTTFASRFGAFK